MHQRLVAGTLTIALAVGLFVSMARAHEEPAVSRTTTGAKQAAEPQPVEVKAVEEAPPKSGSELATTGAAWTLALACTGLALAAIGLALVDLATPSLRQTPAGLPRRAPPRRRRGAPVATGLWISRTN